jgi:hypothetical protein
MDRNANLRQMDAPGVNSGKHAGDTILAHTATGKTSAEAEGNELKEYKTPAPPKGDLGGRNQFE